MYVVERSRNYPPAGILLLLLSFRLRSTTEDSMITRDSCLIFFRRHPFVLRFGFAQRKKYLSWIIDDVERS